MYQREYARADDRKAQNDRKDHHRQLFAGAFAGRFVIIAAVFKAVAFFVSVALLYRENLCAPIIEALAVRGLFRLGDLGVDQLCDDVFFCFGFIFRRDFAGACFIACCAVTASARFVIFDKTRLSCHSITCFPYSYIKNAR